MVATEKATPKVSMWDRYQLKIELLEPLLGTIPKDPEVYTAYLKTKDVDKRVKDPDGADTEETVNMEELEERGWTGFYTMGTDDLRPALMDYQVKGFLKEAANVTKDVLKLKALRSHVDSEVFVYPRRTPLCEVDELPLPYLERPLRAMTALGPRVSVIRSDFVSEGREYVLDLKILKTSRVTKEVLDTILEYGEHKGLGQWRNGGYGRFAGYVIPQA